MSMPDTSRTVQSIHEATTLTARIVGNLERLSDRLADCNKMIGQTMDNLIPLPKTASTSPVAPARVRQPERDGIEGQINARINNIDDALDNLDQLAQRVSTIA